MSFFEAPQPPPERPPQPPRYPWHGPSDAVVGQAVAVNLLLGRSEKAAVWIPSLDVYPDGFEFSVEIRHRLDEQPFDPFYGHGHHPGHRRRSPEEGLDPGLLRLGVHFSDGGKATTLSPNWPFASGPDAAPVGPTLSGRGGGGSGGRGWAWHQGFWVWPLPPEGPMAFVCEWPSADIPETRTEIDSALVRGLAADALTLWPEAEVVRGVETPETETEP
jgi:hypothetical protein